MGCVWWTGEWYFSIAGVMGDKKIKDFACFAEGFELMSCGQMPTEGF